MLLYTLSAIVCFTRKLGNPTSGTLSFRVCLIVSIVSYCTNYVFCLILEAIKHLFTRGDRRNKIRKIDSDNVVSKKSYTTWCFSQRAVSHTRLLNLSLPITCSRRLALLFQVRQV